MSTEKKFAEVMDALGELLDMVGDEYYDQFSIEETVVFHKCDKVYENYKNKS